MIVFYANYETLEVVMSFNETFLYSNVVIPSKFISIFVYKTTHIKGSVSVYVTEFSVFFKRSLKIV